MLIENFLNYLRFTSFGIELRRFVMKKSISKKKKIDQSIRKHIKESLSETEYNKLYRTIHADIKKYGCLADEWFMFGFANMTDEEKESYVSIFTQIFVCEKFNTSKDLPIFRDKDKTYKEYRKYYGRDLLVISEKNGADENEFLTFAQNNEKFVAKPRDGSLGEGFKVFDVTEYENTEQLYQLLLKEYAPKGCVVEGLIQQTGIFHDIHPSSVNTVRISTIRFDDRVEIIHPFAKFGQAGTCVDNGGAGGILCTIDPNTGVIMRARDEQGTCYEKHPDTGSPIVGTQIPKWEEAVALAKELAHVRPQNRYVGWDVALTDNGWVLVEGNFRGQFIGWQLVDRKGFKKELAGILKELNISMKL